MLKVVGKLNNCKALIVNCYLFDFNVFGNMIIEIIE